MKKLSFLVIILLASCAPSASSIATAIVQTQAAAEATQAAAATATPTVTSTSTPTVTPTMTSTPDMRVIEGNPYNFLLKQIDFPAEGRYYLPNQGWIHENTNSEVILNRGVEEGKQYVNRTGRIDGWWEDYARGTIGAQLPEEIWCGVYFFNTKDGAVLALHEYMDPTVTDPTAGFKKVENSFLLGDLTNYYEKIDINKNRVWRDVYFTYYNVVVDIEAYGIDADVSWDVVTTLAGKVLAKLQAAPLTNP